jgi:hypothetical protein
LLKSWTPAAAVPTAAAAAAGAGKKSGGEASTRRDSTDRTDPPPAVTFAVSVACAPDLDPRIVGWAFDAPTGHVVAPSGGCLDGTAMTVSAAHCAAGAGSNTTFAHRVRGGEPLQIR